MREWSDQRRPALEREPWCSAPPFAILCLQHRLALHSNAEIAAHYGRSVESVWLHNRRLLAHVRRMCPLPVHDLADVLVLAERDGVPLRQLTGSGSDRGEGLPEGETHS